MSIKAIVDEVPEGMEEHYSQREDGKYQLAVEAPEGWALEDVAGLKSAYSKEKENRKALERKVKAYGDLDPDAAREAIAKWDEIKDLDPKKDADRIAQEKFEALQSQFTKKHAAEMRALQDENKKLRHMNAEAEIERAMSGQLQENDSPKLIRLLIKERTRIAEDDDGNTIIHVLDDNGNPRITKKSGSNELMGIDELLQELRSSEEYGRAFGASGTSGSGMRPGSGVREPGQLKRSKMTAAQKNDYIEKHGQQAYLKLPT